MFDMKRAKKYTRGALCITLPSSEPAMYLKGSWRGNPGKEVSENLATFLAKGTSSESPTQERSEEVGTFLDSGLSGLGFGCQILPGPHFTMSAGGGDVYGCAPGGLTKEDDTEPLAYKRAFAGNKIDEFINSYPGVLTDAEKEGITLALGSLAFKVAPIWAYQLVEGDDLSPVVTIVNGKEEATSTPKVGDWMVKQKAGEVMVIPGNKWDGFSYVEID